MMSQELSFSLLIVDTSSDWLHLGLTDQQGQWLVQESVEVSSQRSHSSLLLPMISDALQRHGLTPQDLRGLAVNQGPGSFTGLRSSLVIVRTMAQWLPELKVYRIHRMQWIAMAAALSGSIPEGSLCRVILHARRGMLYHWSARYQEGQWIDSIEPELIQKDTLQDIPAIYLVDETLDSIQSTQVQIESLHPFWLEACVSLLTQSASTHAIDWPSLAPLYLQEPNITLRKKKSITS